MGVQGQAEGPSTAGTAPGVLGHATWAPFRATEHKGWPAGQIQPSPVSIVPGTQRVHSCVCVCVCVARARPPCAYFRATKEELKRQQTVQLPKPKHLLLVTLRTSFLALV